MPSNEENDIYDFIDERFPQNLFTHEEMAKLITGFLEGREDGSASKSEIEIMLQRVLELRVTNNLLDMCLTGDAIIHLDDDGGLEFSLTEKGKARAEQILAGNTHRN